MNDTQVLGLIILINGQTGFLLFAINDMHFGFMFLSLAISCIGIYFLFRGAAEEDK